MVTPKQKALIIPDIHQNVRWARKVIEKERAHIKSVVFLGDYFDHRNALYEGVEETVDFLIERMEERDRGLETVFLLGNHDYPYLAELQKTTTEPSIIEIIAGPTVKRPDEFSTETLHVLRETLPGSFWQEVKLFEFKEGFLLSHAGFAEMYWPSEDTLGKSLARLAINCEEALKECDKGTHPLLSVGQARGGGAEKGGPLWLDWEKEFEDHLPIPQIVGHSSDEKGARQNGRSWCIDGAQSCYALLDDNGEVEIRKLV